MKFFTYCLTSTQLAPILPSILDHWFFNDPAAGVSFTYPHTTYAGTFSTLSACDTPAATTFSDGCFSLYVCGGMFFPWGYQVRSESSDVVLGAGGRFKGDVTITFIPSCLDTTYHDIFKISYTFGDGLEYSVQKSPVGQQIFNTLEQFTSNYELNSPKFTPVSHVYHASSQPITYTPSLTVFYGDLTFVFFNFSFTVYPNSIYEIDDVHLINSVQLPGIDNSNLNIIEVESEKALSNIIITSNPVSSI